MVSQKKLAYASGKYSLPGVTGRAMDVKITVLSTLAAKLVHTQLFKIEVSKMSDSHVLARTPDQEVAECILPCLVNIDILCEGLGIEVRWNPASEHDEVQWAPTVLVPKLETCHASIQSSIIHRGEVAVSKTQPPAPAWPAIACNNMEPSYHDGLFF